MGNAYRSGPSQQVKGTVDAGVAVEVGDLLFLSGNYVQPADSIADGSVSDMQHAFAQSFVGASQDTRLASETVDGPVLIETAGVHKYPCDALGTTWPLGSYVAIDVDATTAGTAAAQKVVPTATLNNAIGYMTRNHVAGETAIEFVLQSSLPLVTKDRD